MKKENNTYLAIVRIKGHEPEDFIMTGKSSAAVKKLLITFFKKLLGEDIEIEVDTVRVVQVDGDYTEIK